jgi:catechol 2,3-dioxygenase-like lactoylglutathione lyase family enzyme
MPYAPGQEEALRSFYSGLLGLAEKKVPDALAGRGFVWFQAGGVDGELHFVPDLPAEPAAARHFCLAVEELAPLRERLEAAGAWTRDSTPIPGRPRFFTRDPAGNLVELTVVEADYRELEGS